MNIFVGNLAHGVTEDDLKQAFAAFGEVASVKIIMDKFSGQSRGFGFVEMPSKTEAQEAMNGLNGKDLKGKPLNVNEARPRAGGQRPRGGGPRGGGGGYRQGGGYSGDRRGGGGRPGGGDRRGGGRRDGGGRSW